MNLPKARSSQLIVQETGDELLVYDLETVRALCLNKTAAAIWKLCDGRRTIPEIAREASGRTGELLSDEFVVVALDRLERRGLLIQDPENSFSMVDRTRREMIRRVGIASTALLPVIGFITVPTAAHSQSSCFANGVVRTCTNTAPGCVQILVSPQIFRCPDSACCSGFCAIQTPNLQGNCAA